MEKESKSGKVSYSNEAIEQLVADFQNSGLTTVQWSAKRGIALGKIRYWLRKRREASSKFSLVPVQVSDSPAGKACLDLRVGAVDLKVSAGSDMGMLAELIRRLG